MAPALRSAARDRALSQPRRGPVRPAPAHPLRRAGQLSRVRRRGGCLAGRRGRRDRGAVPLPRGRDRRPLDSLSARGARSRGLRGRVVPHGPVAGRAGRLRRQARRRRGDVVERGAGRPGHRRRRGVAHGVPADGQLVYPAEQRPDQRRGTGPAARRVRRAARDAEHVGARLPPPAQRAQRVRRAGGGTPGFLRGDVEEPGLHEADEQLRRHALQPRRQRRVVRVHRREDPRAS